MNWLPLRAGSVFRRRQGDSTDTDAVFFCRLQTAQIVQASS